MDILNCIFPIIIALFGACFIGWGIYQIKTGKMVARRVKHAVDEPREAGLAFVVLGLNLIFFLAPFLFSATTSFTPYDSVGLFANMLAIKSTPILACINTAFFVIMAICGFRNHRIFAIKDTKETKSSTQKFFKSIAIVALLRALLFPVEQLLQLLALLPVGPAPALAADLTVILEIIGRPLLLIIICVLYIAAYYRSRRSDKIAKSSKK